MNLLVFVTEEKKLLNGAYAAHYTEIVIVHSMTFKSMISIGRNYKVN